MQFSIQDIKRGKKLYTMKGVRFAFCFLMVIIFSLNILNYISAVAYTDFSVGNIQKLTSNPYKGDLVQFKGVVTADSGNWCDIACQYSTGSDSGYVSDSGEYPSTTLSYGVSQEFPFSIRADGSSGSVLQELVVTCDKTSAYLCYLGSQKSNSVTVSFNFLYAGDDVCTGSREKCADYQGFIGTTDCSCTGGKECRPDGTRNPDEKGCQAYCGNGIYEPAYEDCSCWQDYTCPLGKQCKVEGRVRDSSGCTSFCGNGVCDRQYENCTNCASDCGQCNLMPCTKDSDCSAGYCVWQICWSSVFRINDSHCDLTKSENCANSPQDCTCAANQRCNSGGFCETYCGNGVCELGEIGNCKADCKWCGDGVCQSSESCSSCSVDCGYCRTNTSVTNITSNESSDNETTNNNNSNDYKYYVNPYQDNNQDNEDSSQDNPVVIVVPTNDSQNINQTNVTKYALNKDFITENSFKIVLAVIGMIIIILLAIILVLREKNKVQIKEIIA
jgi:hypothetical protein